MEAMHRRTFLSSVAVTAITVGCLRALGIDTSFSVPTDILNYTSTPKSGKIEVIRSEDSENIYSNTFSIPGANPNNPSSSDDVELPISLPHKGKYRFSVSLESGLSEPFEWVPREDQGLQIEVHSNEITFKKLSIPAP